MTVHRNILSVVILIVTAWTASMAMAQDVSTFRSNRYTVVTNLDMAKARPIAVHMDMVFDEYQRRLAAGGFRQRAGDQMKLYLFDTQEKYVAELASKEVDATGSGGMFFVRSDEAALATFTEGRNYNEMITTLQHEGFHQFAWIRIGSNLPVWANEGMAEYFGDAMLIRNRFITGQVNARRLAHVRRAIENDEAFGFRELLNMTSEQWLARVNNRDARALLMYDQSWSIIHFLVHGNGGRFEPAFMAYLKEIHRGRSSSQAFETAFGSADYDPFEKAWRLYIAGLESDSLTLAQERVGFLAAGLRHLHQRDVTVEDIDQLKTELQRVNYWMSVSSHDISRRLTAADDANFLPPPPDRPRATVTLRLEPTDEEHLPPTVVVRGLRVTVKAVWSLDAQDRLQYQITYE